jgi:hypothetical protein
MQRIMPNIQNGFLLVEYWKILKSRVVNGKEIKNPNPLETKYATFFNAKRAAINASVFQTYLNSYHKGKSKFEIPQTGIVIKATTIWNKNKIPLTFDQRKVLFEECLEAHVKQQNKMCAPLLCLFSGCNLMVITNKDVVGGIANGTTCKFRKVVLKPGSEFDSIQMSGYWVNTISIDDVEYIEVEWQDCDQFVGKFQITTEIGVFKVKYPITKFGISSRIQTSIEMKYLPVIVNHATTGHKLQGKTVKSLMIAEWSRVKNWVYVVISCVKTLDGLFLTNKLPEDIDFLPETDYLDMMDNLRRTVLAIPEQVSYLKENMNQNVE